jgi:hypothetical protein
MVLAGELSAAMPPSECWAADDDLHGTNDRVGMLGLSVIALGPILVLAAVLATDLWVYADARARWERGAPVILTLGFLQVDTPAAWFVGCLLLWIVFFPLYIKASRDRAG